MRGLILLPFYRGLQRSTGDSWRPLLSETEGEEGREAVKRHRCDRQNDKEFGSRRNVTDKEEGLLGKGSMDGPSPQRKNYSTEFTGEE